MTHPQGDLELAYNRMISLLAVAPALRLAQYGDLYGARGGVADALLPFGLRRLGVDVEPGKLEGMSEVMAAAVDLTIAVKHLLDRFGLTAVAQAEQAAQIEAPAADTPIAEMTLLELREALRAAPTLPDQLGMLLDQGDGERAVDRWLAHASVGEVLAKVRSAAELRAVVDLVLGPWAVRDDMANSLARAIGHLRTIRDHCSQPDFRSHALPDHKYVGPAFAALEEALRSSALGALRLGGLAGLPAASHPPVEVKVGGAQPAEGA